MLFEIESINNFIEEIQLLHMDNVKMSGIRQGRDQILEYQLILLDDYYSLPRHRYT